MKTVVSIQYPSGGFGHTIHVVLSMFGKNFVGAPVNYEFGISGDSHGFPNFLPKLFDTSNYNVESFNESLSNIQDNKNVTVLIDSGISDDSIDFKKLILSDYSIRICYDDWSWPLLAKLFYTRCMSSVNSTKHSISDFISPDNIHWAANKSQPWAVREKYFLYLRDHHFRQQWRPVDGCVTLPVEKILNYKSLYHVLNQWFEVNEFEDFHKQWHRVNKEHFDFYFDCLHIIDCVESKKSLDLTAIDDLFSQSVVYYYIWLKYNVEVPHNDYSNWFTNSDEIVTMLTKHGVEIDSH